MRHLARAAIVLGLAFAGPAVPPGFAATPPSVGRTSFYGTKIQVGEMAANLRFYGDILGLRRVANDVPGHEDVVLLRAEGGMARGPAEGPMLILTRVAAPPRAGTAHGPLVFVVGDIDARVARMKAAGARILSAPKRSGSVVIAYVSDPDDRTVELMQSPAS